MKKIVTLLTVLLCGYLLSNAQTRTIAGRVVDTAGRGIEGAFVMIKGMSTINSLQVKTNKLITGYFGC